MSEPDYVHPQWGEARQVHDWRNHIPEEIRDIWGTFSVGQRAALHAWAEDLADMEEWD
ncbi:hypothetical protein [Novosphingobium guangzhouense]|nr:hypothetical protein [Novosphingobium guangzhouense]